MSIDTIIATIRTRHQLKEDVQVKIMATAVTLKAADPDDPYKFTARVTTDALDRQDEAVLPQGGDLNEFYRCGCVAWNHDYSNPVGFPNKMKQAGRSDSFIDVGAIFMKRPPDFVGEFFPDFARAFVEQARAAGIAPGVSIGFVPIESRLPSKADKSRWGERIQCVHSKWKLLEFSIAPVQANQEAVVTAIGKGLIKRDVAKAIGYDVAKIPLLPAPEPKVIREVLCIRVPSKQTAPDVAGMAKAGVKREILKSFGKMYG